MTFNVAILRAAKDLLVQADEQQIPRALRAHGTTGGANG